MIFDMDDLPSSKFWHTLNVLTHGGYMAALMGPGLVLTACILIGHNITLDLLIISYLVILINYSWDYHHDLIDLIQTNSGKVLQSQNKATTWYKYIFFSYIIATISIIVWNFNLGLFLFISLITLGGLVYGKFLKKLTRTIPLFKNIYVTFLLVSFSVLLPIYYHSSVISLATVLVFIFIYIKMGINNVFFDLKDILLDSQKGIKTLPVLIGKTKTIKILHFVNIIALMPLFIGIYCKIFPIYCLLLIPFHFYTMYYLEKGKDISKHNELIKLALIADLEFILWPIILIIPHIYFA